jgi:hypothetical protein
MCDEERVKMCIEVLTILDGFTSESRKKIHDSLRYKPLGHIFSAFTQMEREILDTTAYITLNSMNKDQDLTLLGIPQKDCVMSIIEIIISGSYKTADET